MRHLVIMIKEPVPGRVKTRLACDVGAVRAAWWFRHQTARLVRRVGRDPRWQTWLSVAPDGALASAALPGGTRRLPQGDGDLGDRMRRAFQAMPPGPTLVIGADIPGIDARRIWRGFEALRGADAVFGPAPDGGYWLVGLRNRHVADQGFLSSVRWSSADALADSEASLRGRWRVARADELTDVDRLEDLRAAQGAIGLSPA